MTLGICETVRDATALRSQSDSPHIATAAVNWN